MADEIGEEYNYAVCGVFYEMCPKGNGKRTDLATELFTLVKGDCGWAEGQDHNHG